MVKYRADVRYSATEFSTHDKYAILPLHSIILLERLKNVILHSATPNTAAEA